MSSRATRVLVVGATRLVADRLDAAVRAAGITDMRAPFGFVVRALADMWEQIADGHSTLTIILKLPGTPQGASVVIKLGRLHLYLEGLAVFLRQQIRLGAVEHFLPPEPVADDEEDVLSFERGGASL